MLKTYHGSCHCGAVRFEADIDLAQGVGKCNCTICTKTRNWSALLKPDAFRLLAGEADLSDYQFGSKQGHHVFCKHCGVRSFSRGYVKEIGGDFVSVQLACLDDASPEELINAETKIGNGRDNLWWETPAETKHL
ncbi:MAG: GFA family protein [Beijerinckiaceae bacterium]